MNELLNAQTVGDIIDIPQIQEFLSGLSGWESIIWWRRNSRNSSYHLYHLQNPRLKRLSQFIKNVKDRYYANI